MSAAVMPSSMYELNEFSINMLKQHHHTQPEVASKMGWESGNESDCNSVMARSPSSTTAAQLPISIMTSFLLDNIHQQHRRLERTQSEPAKVPSLNANSSRSYALSDIQDFKGRYKTELCRPYEESGTCKYGEKCQFAHGGHELRCLVRHPKYKTELCRTFHSVGFCPYGPRCHFIHNAEEARSGGGGGGGGGGGVGAPPSPVAVVAPPLASSPPTAIIPHGSASPTVASNVTKSRPRPLSLTCSSTDMSSSSSSGGSPPSSLGSISPPPAFSAPGSPPPPPASPESRLPVFNRISAPPNHQPFYLSMRFSSELIV